MIIYLFSTNFLTLGAHSGVLSQLLYGQPELCPSELKALKVAVDPNFSPSLINSISRRRSADSGVP